MVYNHLSNFELIRFRYNTENLSFLSLIYLLFDYNVYVCPVECKDTETSNSI